MLTGSVSSGIIATGVLLCGLACHPVVGVDAAATQVVAPNPQARPAVPGETIFRHSGVHHLRLEIDREGVAGLRQAPRDYVRATFRSGAEVFTNVGVHLKGATGSFRSLDDKPALTLNFARFQPGQTFHGLRKMHLNNSVEDPAYLNEYLGAYLFQSAGVPAPRVAWALLELNGRKLGLYVLKEGFTEDFLGLHFSGTQGNLYDTGPGHDVNEPIERDSGAGPDDRADLKAITSVLAEPDLEARWRRLEQVLDVDRFISFMAMEVMAGHRDGYCLARNNFRIYHDPGLDRLVFLPHGMDQLFGKADAPMLPLMNGLVARALMETPEGRSRYQARFAFLLTNVFKVEILTALTDVRVKELLPALDRNSARALEMEAVRLKDRIRARFANLEEQASRPPLQRLRFESDIARLVDWVAVDEPAQGKMEKAPGPDNRLALRINAGPVTAASWRSRVLLEKGRYRFEGGVSTEGVVPLAQRA